MISFRFSFCVGRLEKIKILPNLIRKLDLTERSVNIAIYSESVNFERKPTVVVIHGWKGPFNMDFEHTNDEETSNDLNDFLPSHYDYKLKHVGDAFKENHDVNVVVVKWGAGFISSYDAFIFNLPNIAMEVAVFLDKNLGTNPVLWRNLTIVGHSLGMFF